MLVSIAYIGGNFTCEIESVPVTLPFYVFLGAICLIFVM